MGEKIICTILVLLIQILSIIIFHQQMKLMNTKKIYDIIHIIYQIIIFIIFQILIWRVV